MPDEKLQLHAIVHGRVQGVSFRYYTTLRAAESGIVGWVQNLPDGTVEVEAEGTRQQLDGFANFLRKGPLGARVASVDIDWQPASGNFINFVIR
ncbi:MAG: acylphosphatase [Chloroflexota bacterium]